MRIELKNVKIVKSMSRGTTCFSATIHVDGAAAGSVENDGHGGCHRFHPTGLLLTLDEHAKTLPAEFFSYSLDGKCFQTAPSADGVIDKLLDEHELRQSLKTSMRGHILFTRTDAKTKRLQVLRSTKLDAQRMAALLQRPQKLVDAWKAEQILNLLPEAEALALYRAGTAG